MDPITAVLVVALAAEIVVCLYAAWWLRRRYAPVRGESAFLDRLLDRDLRVAVGGGLVGVIIAYSLVRFAFPDLALGQLVPPLGALLIVGPLMLMLWGPISDWLEARKVHDADA